jgi:hypothetical protein
MPIAAICSETPERLRELAAWYRSYADRAPTPWVWEGRLRTAEEFEREAACLDAQRSSKTRCVTSHTRSQLSRHRPA